MDREQDHRPNLTMTATAERDAVAAVITDTDTSRARDCPGLVETGVHARRALERQ
jgi:hypothetical protein